YIYTRALGIIVLFIAVQYTLQPFTHRLRISLRALRVPFGHHKCNATHLCSAASSYSPEGDAAGVWRPRWYAPRGGAARVPSPVERLAHYASQNQTRCCSCLLAKQDSPHALSGTKTRLNWHSARWKMESAAPALVRPEGRAVRRAAPLPSNASLITPLKTRLGVAPACSPSRTRPTRSPARRLD
ncbi:hypothetical protein C8J57DRAFT_1555069, partial [Mycena rebaudengoi]